MFSELLNLLKLQGLSFLFFHSFSPIVFSHPSARAILQHLHTHTYTHTSSIENPPVASHLAQSNHGNLAWSEGSMICRLATCCLLCSKISLCHFSTVSLCWMPIGFSVTICTHHTCFWLRPFLCPILCLEFFFPRIPTWLSELFPDHLL